MNFKTNLLEDFVNYVDITKKQKKKSFICQNPIFVLIQRLE